MLYTHLQSTDPEAFALLKKEQQRQQESIELIASENYASASVIEALGSVLTNKYSEGSVGKRYYAGNSVVDEVEALAINRAKELFTAEHVNVQALSGAPANIAVYLALLQPGDTVLGMGLEHGGHLSHGHSLNFSGLHYNFVSYTVDKTTGMIDMEEVSKLASEHKPKMILAGFSSYSRNLDWQKFREIADGVGAILFADISHIAGLVAGKALRNPVPLCDVVMTTTHKTLRGPRGAMIMCKEKYAKAIDRAVFPGVQGGPHNNTILAKAVCFAEAQTKEFADYCEQVILNSQHMAGLLVDLGYRVLSGGTDNHLILINAVESRGLSGKELSALWESVGIIVNKNVIPYETKSPLDPSGVRLGTPGITTRGMKQAEVTQIVSLMDAAVSFRNHTEELNSIKEQVKNLALRYLVPGV